MDSMGDHNSPRPFLENMNMSELVKQEHPVVEQTIRHVLPGLGYRLIKRRDATTRAGAQYLIMVDRPMSLYQVGEFAMDQAEKRQARKGNHNA
jgi:hypothetical protein